VDWAEDEDEDDTEEKKNTGGAEKKSVRLLDYACGTGVGEFELCLLFLSARRWTSFTLPHYPTRVGSVVPGRLGMANF
jgi:hypothetical protein